MSALLAAGQLGSAPHPAHMSVLRGGGSTAGLSPSISNGGVSVSGAAGAGGAGGPGSSAGAAGGSGGGGEAGGALSGRRVLLVEDNLINQTVARKVGQGRGRRDGVRERGG